LIDSTSWTNNRARNLSRCKNKSVSLISRCTK